MPNQNNQYVSLQITGISRTDIEHLEATISIRSASTTSSQNSGLRSGVELLSAAFIIGIANATPGIVKALTDLLSEIRRSKYVTFKLTSADGKSLIEGSATPERINQLTAILEHQRKLP